MLYLKSIPLPKGLLSFRIIFREMAISASVLLFDANSIGAL